MHRILKAITLAAALSTAAGIASAQNFTFDWNPRTGDVWVDNSLNDINQYGQRYRDPFIDEMTRYYGAPRDLVSDLLINRHWAPGDVYYACALAQVTGQPCRTVVDEWDRDHGQGWGVIAQRMGIRPGSAEFHRLKRGFVPTYDRWGRPIRIDDSLRIDFPNRDKGPKGTAGLDRLGHGGKQHGKSMQHGGAMKHGHRNAGHAPAGAHGHGNGRGGNAEKHGHGNDRGNSGDGGSGRGNSGKGKGKGKGKG